MAKSYTVVINPGRCRSRLLPWGMGTANVTGYSQTINASGGTGALTFSEAAPFPLV